MDKLTNFIDSKTMNHNSELELRMGSFNGKFFNSKISKRQFDYIKTLLIESTRINIIDTAFLNCPYRQRKIDGEKSVWIRKEKISKLDIPEFNMRVSFVNEIESDYVSVIKELQIQNPDMFFSPKNVSLLRKKKRLSKYFKDWRADLTYVEHFKFVNDSWSLLERLYEFELEYIPKGTECSYDVIDKFFTLNDYFLITHSNFFIGNHPMTLERKDIPLLASGYSLTAKVDGERMFLVLNSGKMTIFDKKLSSFIFGSTTIHGTIIDGEFYNNQFLAFDLLYNEGVNITNKTLVQRHILLDSVVSKLNSENVIVKHFYYSEQVENISFVSHANIFIKAKEIWTNRKPYLDGLIFTPIHEPYSFKTKTFKWKETVTIDTLVKFENNRMEMYGNNRGTLVKINEHTFEKGLKTDTIYEFKKLNNQWVSEKERPDKTFPNAILTISSAILAIKENISIDDLNNSTGTQYSTPGKELKVRNTEADVKYRKFHNAIKKSLIEYKHQNQKEKENTFLLDLGAGKGGDMLKWKSAGYTHVLAIDSSWQHIYGPNGLIERYKKQDSLNVDLTIIWGDVSKNIRGGDAGLDKENKKNLKNFFKRFPRLKFDKITCNFAIHYFFESKDIWDSFIKNVKLLLAKGGLFVGTYLDSDKIKSGEFYNKDILIYTILEPVPNKPEDYWKTLPKIKIKTLQWDNFIPEPMIYSDQLCSLFKKNKFEIVSHENFKKYNHLTLDMSQSEKKISFMHNFFIYTLLNQK
jgi:hypothetical protein